MTIHLDFQVLFEKIETLQQQLDEAELLSDIVFLPRNGRELADELESIVSAVHQTFGGEDLYPSVVDKATQLLCKVVREHPLIDGNKRMATLLFRWFLGQHNLTLLMGELEQVELVIFITETSSEDDSKVFAGVGSEIEKYLAG